MAAPFTDRPKFESGYVFGFNVISSTVKKMGKEDLTSVFYEFEIMCCGYKWVEIIVSETSRLGNYMT